MTAGQHDRRRGPLRGISVLEFAGLGPTPFTGMMLADMGARVLRIDRKGDVRVSAGDPRLDTLNRGRPSLALDLKDAESVAVAKSLVERADVLVEGFRPGVMERLGLGPVDLQERNPGLIYARVTGWGQESPLAKKAGHDINYLALTGGLHMMGPAGAPPLPPLNLVGDFGGGGMFALAGILAALVERASSGRGQVVDAAMVDGVAMLLAQAYAWREMGFWTDERGHNLLDGGAYFYRCYETKDERYIAVGAIEPQFHDSFIEGLGLDPAAFRNQMDRSHWQERSQVIASVIRQRSRNQWVDTFASRDACITPVLSPAEAPHDPANKRRRLFEGQAPRPAPRYSAWPDLPNMQPRSPGEGGAEALVAWGVHSTRTVP